MTCPINRNNTEMLVAYAAGQLDPPSVARLELHFADCPECRSQAADQTALWKALDTWETPAVSPDFNRRLYSRIADEGRLPWWGRFLRSFRVMPLRQALPLTACAGLLIAAGIALENPGFVAPTPVRPQVIRAEQVESTLDDIELLRQFGAANSTEGAHPDAM